MDWYLHYGNIVLCNDVIGIAEHASPDLNGHLRGERGTHCDVQTTQLFINIDNRHKFQAKNQRDIIFLRLKRTFNSNYYMNHL